tara:strand:+ start:1091 stop:1831 length:741 start_codon:yes stop_codon:yes gene_type:complete
MDDFILEEYYKDLSHVVLLTKAEEAALYRKYEKGESQAGHKLVEGCLRLCFSIAKGYWKDNNPETLKELISAGNEGLIRALPKFKPEKDVKFSTYAGYWILMYIRKYAVEDSKIVKPPIKSRRKAKLSAELKASPDSLVYIKTLEDVNMSSTIDGPDIEVETAEYKAIQKMRTDTLLRFLTNRERIVIERSFGLQTGKEESLKSIGRDLSLSSERVRQVKEVARLKLERWAKYYEEPSSSRSSDPS